MYSTSLNGICPETQTERCRRAATTNSVDRRGDEERGRELVLCERWEGILVEGVGWKRLKRRWRRVERPARQGDYHGAPFLPASEKGNSRPKQENLQELSGISLPSTRSASEESREQAALRTVRHSRGHLAEELGEVSSRRLPRSIEEKMLRHCRQSALSALYLSSRALYMLMIGMKRSRGRDR